MISRIRAVLLAGALGAMATTANAQTTPDLAMVPSDAAAFVHIRVADIWKHDLMKGLRDTVAAAGPKALDAYGKQVYPHPDQIDRVTAYLTLNETNPKNPPNIVVIVAFKSDVDGEKVRKLYLPEAKTADVGGKKVVTDADKGISAYMPDAKHLIIGNLPGVSAQIANAGKKGDGALTPAITAAASKVLTMAVNVKALPIPPDAWKDVPPDIQPLLKADRVVLTIDAAGASPVIELKAGYANEAAAVDAEKGLKAAVAMAKGFMKKAKDDMEKKLYENADKGPQGIEKMGEVTMALVAVGGMNRAEEMLDKLPIVRSGNELQFKFEVPKEIAQMVGVYSAGLGLLLPATQRVRMAASGSASANNLKQIGLAFHNAYDQMNKMPAAAICNKEGKPLLSWRVAILPYLEQQALYDQFKLDEPWDSEHNKKLIEKMPPTLRSPRVETKPGMTVYKAFVGKDAILNWTEGRRFEAIHDGSSNTFLVAEAGEPVIWTKPEDIEFDPAKPLPKLELPGGLTQINVLFADGSVRRVDLKNVTEKTLKIYIGAMDGQVPPDLDEPSAATPGPAVERTERKIDRPEPESRPVPPKP